MTQADASVSRFSTKYNETFLYISKYCGKKTNFHWFAVVWTLIYHDLRHHMVKISCGLTRRSAFRFIFFMNCTVIVILVKFLLLV